MMLRAFSTLLLCLPLLVKSQPLLAIDSLTMLPDSVNPFPLESYFSLILKNHPVAKQADLLPEVARQEIRMARGSFDPKIEAQIATKSYDGQTYYSRAGGSLKLPTRFPVNPSVGIQRNTGPYLNPEGYISREFNYVQYQAGISIPLARGLLTDERRTALTQAGLFRDMTEAEQVKVINKLLLEGANDYWNWYYAFNRYRLITRNVEVASQIYQLVWRNYQLGEAAAIDTIQAMITLQQRKQEQTEAWLDFLNTGIRLSNALWDSLGNPVALDDRWGPVLETEPWLLSRGELEELAMLAKENHPELRSLQAKLKQLEAERRLAAEYLKPQIDLNYYILNQPVNPSGESAIDLTGSYKLGVDFSIPLFLRKERSKLSLARLKLSNMEYEQTLTEREIINELNATFNELSNLAAMTETQHDMMLNYERLLTAELLNLSQGESDLFKINIQQEKLIQAQSKWLKLTTDFQKQKAYLYWAAGNQPLVD